MYSDNIFVFGAFSVIRCYFSVPQALGKKLGISTTVKTLSDLYEWGVLSRPVNN